MDKLASTQPIKRSNQFKGCTTSLCPAARATFRDVVIVIRAVEIEGQVLREPDAMAWAMACAMAFLGDSSNRSTPSYHPNF